MGEYAGLIQNKYKIENLKSFIQKAKDLDIEFTNPVSYEYTYFKVDTTD